MEVKKSHHYVKLTVKYRNGCSCWTVRKLQFVCAFIELQLKLKARNEIGAKAMS